VSALIWCLQTQIQMGLMFLRFFGMNFMKNEFSSEFWGIDFVGSFGDYDFLEFVDFEISEIKDFLLLKIGIFFANKM
jgi:hypothetical protein